MYFGLVLLFTMFLMHPVGLVISFGCASNAQCNTDNKRGINRLSKKYTGNILKVHGEHRKVGTISDKLYKKLRNNGAAFEVLDRLFPEKTERKELVS